MEVNNRIVDIIEDHESIVKTLSAIANAIDNKLPMPNSIPVLNNLAVTDLLSKICETLENRRKCISTL